MADKREDVYRKVYEEAMEARACEGVCAPGIKAVIAVSGAAALGKTTFCSGLADYVGSCGVSVAHVQLDGFLLSRREREELGLSGYDPSATDLPEMLHVLERLLLSGEVVEVPLYDHGNGLNGSSVRVEPCEVMVLDGIMSMEDYVRLLYPMYCVFMAAKDSVMRKLRLKVDVSERGYSEVEARRRIGAELRAYSRHILRQVNWADLAVMVGADRELRVPESLYWKDIVVGTDLMRVVGH